VIRVYGEAGKVIETPEHAGGLKAPSAARSKSRHAMKA